MAFWRSFALGERIRGLPRGCEERLAFDRARGRAVTLRTYRRPPTALPELLEPRPPQLAQPLEVLESGAPEQGGDPNAPGRLPEAVVVRELAFGPSLADLMAVGPLPEPVVGALLQQVLQGLAPLHAAGRAHLRLSPDAARFDLLESRLKVLDLEEAVLAPTAPDVLIPRYLDPALRFWPGTASSDVYSVGRLGEALLRGGDPLGPWPAGSAQAERTRGLNGTRGPLWGLIELFQEPPSQGRPVDATAALALLVRLGPLPRESELALPIAGFVRRQVRGLRQLRRWRAEPPPPQPRASVAPAGEPGYQAVLSSARARRLWGTVVSAAGVSLLLTLAVVAAPARGGAKLSAPRFGAEACVPEALPELLATGAGPSDAGRAVLELADAKGAALAIDGCPVFPLPEGAVRLGLGRGVHELRAAIGTQVLSQRVEVAGEAAPSFDLGASPMPRGEGQAAVELLARHLAGVATSPTEPEPAERGQGSESAPGSAAASAEPAFDPIEAGLIDPRAQRLLAVDGALVADSPELRAALPDGLALALDGLRAAHRRLAVQSAPCEVLLATAVNQRWAGGRDSPGTAPSGPGVAARPFDRGLRAQEAAAEFLTVTRLHGSQMVDPFLVERAGLAQLGVAPGRRLLGIVDQLTGDPAIARCLADLSPTLNEIDGLSGLALAQLPTLALPTPEAAEAERGLQ